MTRLLGKRAAVHDPRMAALRSVMATLPTAPAAMNWQAHMPDDGVPMLGNDQVGDCVLASTAHWVQIASGYTGAALPSAPSADECVAAYSAITGYDPNNPLTDQGTVVMGPGGLVEYWTRTGIMIGGELSKLQAAVTIDHTNLDHLDAALTLGPVFCGALISQGDMDSDFLWDAHDGDILGGHEFLLVNREIISTGKRYYDICTWDGLWRCTDSWLLAAADEMMVPLVPSFFDAHGVDPAGIDMAAVEAAMAGLRA